MEKSSLIAAAWKSPHPKTSCTGRSAGSVAARATTRRTGCGVRGAGWTGLREARVCGEAAEIRERLGALVAGPLQHLPQGFELPGGLFAGAEKAQPIVAEVDEQHVVADHLAQAYVLQVRNVELRDAPDLLIRLLPDDAEFLGQQQPLVAVAARRCHVDAEREQHPLPRRKHLLEARQAVR